MKTAKCRYCGKEVALHPNQRLKSHLNGSEKCIGIGVYPPGHRFPKMAKMHKKKRSLRHQTI